MRIITASEVERLLPMRTCIGLMRLAMAQLSQGQTVLPLRQFMAVPGTRGKLGLMPGYIAEPACFGVKIVSKYERPPGSAHGSHVGSVMLFEASEGLPLALIEGGMLTAIRTAAATAMATDLLARADAGILLVAGSGEQARRHVDAVAEVRSLRRLLIWSRNPEHAARLVAAEVERGRPAALASDLQAAVAEADIICTTTSAPEPFLLGGWLRPGTHVNLVGSAVATTAEADVECVRRSQFFVDSRASALAQAGELRRAIEEGVVTEAHITAEIGEVLLGSRPGREEDGAITLYKSLGVAAQDLAAAHAVYEASLEQRIGTDLDLSA